MKNIVKSAAVVGKLIGLIMGSGFTTPTTKYIDQTKYIGGF